MCIKRRSLLRSSAALNSGELNGVDTVLQRMIVPELTTALRRTIGTANH